MFGILAKKVAMTTIIDKYNAIPVTVLDVTNNVIVGKRIIDDDKKAVLVGFGKKKKPTKAEQGEYKELGYVPARVIQFTVADDVFDSVKIGDTLTVDLINKLIEQSSKKVDVTGISKGKGFAGVIKRWGFHRQPKTHGQSDRERHPGAIGAQTPGRVFKGKKMAGRMGGNKVTIKNLTIVDLINENSNLYLVVKGAVPGSYKNLVVIKFK